MCLVSSSLFVLSFTVTFFFSRYGDHRDLHVLTHSFPTRRSSDLFGVKRYAALVAVVGLEMRAVQAVLERPERIACARQFDLDHIGAEVGQQHRGRRPGDEGAVFNHPHVRENLAHTWRSAGDRKSTRLNSSH